MPIQMICPADPNDLPCQSSFGGVSHPPTPPSSFAPVRNVLKYEKYSPVKLANFEYLSITRRKMHHFRLKSGVFFRAWY
jgi:hypothetical protein